MKGCGASWKTLVLRPRICLHARFSTLCLLVLCGGDGAEPGWGCICKLEEDEGNMLSGWDTCRTPRRGQPFNEVKLICN